MLYLAILWLDSATGRSATARCCSTPAPCSVVGTQLVSLGILAELVTAYNIRRRGHVQRRRDARKPAASEARPSEDSR